MTYAVNGESVGLDTQDRKMMSRVHDLVPMRCVGFLLAKSIAERKGNPDIQRELFQSLNRSLRLETSSEDRSSW